MSKNLKTGIILIIAGLAIWYFFKGYNYRITFKINQPKSIVYNRLLKWNDNKTLKDSAVINLEATAAKKIVQRYRLGDTLLRIRWRLKRLNDNSTKVIANITDERRPILANVTALNPNGLFVENNKKVVKRFAKGLVDFGNTFNLGDIEEDTIPSRYCAYISLKSTVDSKARIMSQNISLVMDYIKAYSIKLSSDPFLEVTKWNVKNDSLFFNFCFPIKEVDSIPPTGIIKFKKTKKKKGLKVKFNGNYRGSNLAWLALLDYASYNKIRVEKEPVEFFLNDPHTGTNPMEWEALVYLPLQ